MAFKHVRMDTTMHHKPEGVITGKRDAIFLRNKYQTQLDNRNAAVVNMVKYIQEKNSDLKSQYNYALGLKKDVDAHEEERSKLYDSLGNLLTKETNFEDKMWQTTQKGRKVKSVTIKQKFKDSDVEEMRYDSMMDYLKQYPEYASKSSFRKILDKIEEKEREIRHSKQKYNDGVSKYNYLLSDFRVHIQKAEDKIRAYNKVYEEGKHKLENTRYRKGLFYKLASEETRAKVELDTLTHNIDQFKNTLEIIKKEHSKNEAKTFNEMEY